MQEQAHHTRLSRLENPPLAGQTMQEGSGDVMNRMANRMVMKIAAINLEVVRSHRTIRTMRIPRNCTKSLHVLITSTILTNGALLEHAAGQAGTQFTGSSTIIGQLIRMTLLILEQGPSLQSARYATPLSTMLRHIRQRVPIDRPLAFRQQLRGARRSPDGRF